MQFSQLVTDYKSLYREVKSKENPPQPAGSSGKVPWALNRTRCAKYGTDAKNVKFTMHG